MKYLIVLICSCMLLSCSKENSNESFLDCEELSGDYKNYNGEEIDCKFFYTLTEFEGQQFIELGSHCADLTRSVVINEACEDICATAPYDTTSPCGLYLSGRQIIEVIFIEN